MLLWRNDWRDGTRKVRVIDYNPATKLMKLLVGEDDDALYPNGFGQWQGYTKPYVMGHKEAPWKSSWERDFLHFSFKFVEVT